MTRIRTVSDLGPAELEGRRLLVRVDYNVPVEPGGTIGDTTRLERTLPTLELLVGAGARLVLVSHLGRPGGAPDPAASLAPVATALSERLRLEAPLVEGDPTSNGVQEAVGGLAPGGVLLLENIRFHPGETKNDPGLAQGLASLVDGFVGDAFGVAHRAHASNVGAARAIRERGGPAVAGLLMARELHFLRDSLRSPDRPFVAIMGGAKISGKIELIRAILPRVDRLLVGGAMANTFFRALGLETGDSLVEEDCVDLAADLLEEAGEKLVLPVDCVVADRITEEVETVEVERDGIEPGQRVADVGSGSRELFVREIEGAGTVLWNGPLGVFELEPFSGGTFRLARALADVADRGTTVVVGGGDSAAAANAAGVADRMTHISTGGGASLDLLAGRELPGVSVLENVDEEAE